MNPIFFPRNWVTYTNWSNLGINSIIQEWTLVSGAAFTIFVLCAVTSFTLSYNCYSDTDETPIGFKVLFALLSSMWNVVYLIYYFVTVGLMGMKCGN